MNIKQIIAALLWMSLVACGGSVPGTTKVKYEVSAQRNLEKGEERLKAEDWLAASKYFSFVKARFPFSKQSVIAELRLADSEFGAKQYLQAIDSYKLFTKFHPTHEMTTNGYAAFRVGESYIKLLPSDYWMIPPSFEKDQSATTDAHRELSTFIKKYPKSPYRKKGEDYLVKVNTKMASHELYVAKFYWKRDKPNGTILRLRRLLKKNSGSPLDLEALDLLAKAYMRVGDNKRAKTTLEQLVKEHPNSVQAKNAKQSLARLSPSSAS